MNWKAIPKCHYFLTLDVKVRNAGSTTTAVCKTVDDSVVFVNISFFKSQNANQGEATALYSGIEEAKAQLIKEITIGGDS